MQNGSQFGFSKTSSLSDSCAIWCELSYENNDKWKFQVGKFVIPQEKAIAKIAKIDIKQVFWELNKNYN